VKITELIKEGVEHDHAIMTIAHQLARVFYKQRDELIQKILTHNRAHLGKVRDFTNFESEDPVVQDLLDLDVWLDEEERGGSQAAYVPGTYGPEKGQKKFKQVSGDVLIQPNMLYDIDQCLLVLSHELRHALDDIKSKGKAINYVGTRKKDNDYYTKRADPEDEWSTPAELNAILYNVMATIKLNIEDNYAEVGSLDNNDLMEIINNALESDDSHGTRILAHSKNEKHKRVMSRLYQYARHVLTQLENQNK
jgi:hypothetical protein